MERWEAPGCLRGTLEAGLMDPPRAARRPRAPKARRSASQRSTGHQAVGRSGAPRSGQLSLCPLKGRFQKAPLTGQDASRIREASGTGIGIHSQVREREFRKLRSPDAAQRVALAERCAAEPGSRLLATRRNRGPGSAKQRFAKGYALHRARDTRVYMFSTRPYASSTASFIISDSVGCGKMVCISSSSVVSRFIATT